MPTYIEKGPEIFYTNTGRLGQKGGEIIESGGLRTEMEIEGLSCCACVVDVMVGVAARDLQSHHKHSPAFSCFPPLNG